MKKQKNSRSRASLSIRSKRPRSRPPRRSSDAALAESEARFRSLTELSSDWYWEQDAELRFVSTSGRTNGRGGISVADHPGKRRWELPGTELVGQSWAEHQALLAERQPFRDLMLRRTGTDGSDHYIMISGEPFFNARGAFAGYRGVAKDVTERKRSEEALAQSERESNRRLSAAIEHLNESIAIMDAEDRIVVANRYFRELNGGTRLVEPGHLYEEHLRAGIPLGNYPEAVGREEEWLKERLARHLRGGTLEVRRQDGKWLLVTDQRLPDGGMISFALDITERKRMEEELRANLYETDAIFRTSTAGIMLVRERRFVRCNARLEEIFGYSPGELTGKPTRMLYVSEEEWRRAAGEVYPAMSAGQIGHALIAGISKSGRQIWVVLTGKYIDPRRPELGAVFSATDITERKFAEEALRQSEERFRSLADLSSDWYWEQDTELRFVSTFGRESGRGGITAADHTGKRRWELPGTEIENQSWAEHQATLAARAPFHDVLLKRTAAGSTVHYVSISGEPMFNAQGAFTGYRGIARDVTERVVAEKQARAADERLREALRVTNEELERRVAERTAALETAYRELESFSYSVSHDLRSPLGVIASFAGILARQEAGRISEDGMRLVSVIDENAQRMGRLIDALLELMRMSRRALVFRQLEMTAIAGAICRELQRDYPRARIEIGKLPAALGDEMLVHQVYANLVGNALKFSSKAATPRVEVGAEAGAGTSDGTPVYFVRDNGAGFDTDHAAKLFKPFERLHTEDEFPGTGIGLALVQLIVQRHGGRIWADSAPERGSTFRFTLGGGGPG